MADDIVVEKDDDLAPRQFDSGIPGRTGAAILLLDDAECARGPKLAKRRRRAVRRAIDDDDHLILVGRQILLEHRRQSLRDQGFATVIR